MNQCGGTVDQCGTVWWNSVEQYGEKVWNSMVGQCGTVWWNSATVWTSVVEQWNSVVEQCGTVERCGGTVWNGMDQCGAQVEQCETMW